MTDQQIYESTEPAHRRYCFMYWDKNELELIRAGHPSKQADRAIAHLEREMEACVQVLGYVPSP